MPAAGPAAIDADRNASSRRAGYNVATPGRLMDAAERLFAERSYETVALREIATAAGVSAGQIVYHFGQKEDLIRAVILRRAGILTEERLRLLDAYETLVGPDRVEIEPLVRAFVSPYFDRLTSADAGWSRYAQFIGRSVWDSRLSTVFSEAFNRAALRYVDAFRRALPGLSPENALRAFQFMLAAIYGATTRDARINSLAGEAGLESDYDGYKAALVPFIAAGVARLADASGAAPQAAPTPAPASAPTTDSIRKAAP